MAATAGLVLPVTFFAGTAAGAAAGAGVAVYAVALCTSMGSGAAISAAAITTDKIVLFINSPIFLRAAARPTGRLPTTLSLE